MVRSTVKSIDHQVKECIKKISDEDLQKISVRLKERIGSDLAEALLIIQDRYMDLNRILMNTVNADAVYDVVDVIDKYIQEEVKRRMTH